MFPERFKGSHRLGERLVASLQPLIKICSQQLLKLCIGWPVDDLRRWNRIKEAAVICWLGLIDECITLCRRAIGWNGQPKPCLRLLTFDVRQPAHQLPRVIFVLRLRGNTPRNRQDDVGSFAAARKRSKVPVKGLNSPVFRHNPTPERPRHSNAASAKYGRSRGDFASTTGECMFLIMAPRAQSFQCGHGLWIRDGHIIERAAHHIAPFSEQIGAHHGGPRHEFRASEMLAGIILRCADGAGGGDEVIPCPIVLRKRHARLPKQILVVIETNRCEVFGNAPQRAVPGSVAVIAECIHHLRIEVSDLQRARLR